MMSYTMKKLIFFATYNEVGNVASLIRGIRKAEQNADILIVDDSSNDGTLEILEEMKSEALTLIVRPSKSGIGSAHLLALQYAIDHNHDVLVTMDGDLSHDPADIPRLISGVEDGFDFVIGSRYAPGGSCDYKGYRKYLSLLGNYVARQLLGIKLYEFTTSLRAFNVKSLKKIDFSTIDVCGYSFFLTMVVRAHLAKFNIAEIPIHFHERNSGASKIPPLEIFRGIKQLLYLWHMKTFGAEKPNKI